MKLYIQIVINKSTTKKKIMKETYGQIAIRNYRSEKERIKQDSKNRRNYLKSLSPEELAERKSNVEYDKRMRKEAKEEKQRLKEHKILIKRELTLLEYMLKSGTKFHHHSEKEDMSKLIQKLIDNLKINGEITKYHPYIWNYQGQGKNTLPLCQMDNIWRNSDFNTIYDVPLDGTYIFYIYDTGQRGLGSFNHITCSKVISEISVPKINPGGFPALAVY